MWGKLNRKWKCTFILSFLSWPKKDKLSQTKYDSFLLEDADVMKRIYKRDTFELSEYQYMVIQKKVVSR